MIAGVIATLDAAGCHLPDALQEIAQIPSIEIGEVNHDAHRIPITIDSADRKTLEEVTRQLQGCRCVSFVDVVFVHFESESDRVAETAPRRTTCS